MKSTGRKTLQQQGTVLQPTDFEEDRFLHLVKHSDYGGDHGTATTTTIYYDETTTIYVLGTIDAPRNRHLPLTGGRA